MTIEELIREVLDAGQSIEISIDGDEVEVSVTTSANIEIASAAAHIDDDLSVVAEKIWGQI